MTFYNSITGITSCPRLGYDGELDYRVNGPCCLSVGHKRECLPRGGHKPPTFLEGMNARWAAGWRPEHERSDDEHEDWLEWSGGRGPDTDMWERERDARAMRSN